MTNSGSPVQRQLARIVAALCIRMKTAHSKSRWASSWRIASTGAAMAVAFGLAFFWITPLDQWFRGFSYDFPFALRADNPVDEALIVSMDEESYRELNQSLTNDWDRRLHVEVLKQAIALGARAVVFDIWFAAPSPSPAVDQQFAQAMADAPGKVLLAAKLEESIEGKTVVSTVFKPTPLFESAAPWGVAQLPVDPDGTLRRHYTNAQYAPLAWKAVEMLDNAPEAPLQARWINYYGTRGAIPHKSYHDVLRGTNALPPGFFAGKVVFVGRNPVQTPKGAAHEDEHRTPYTRWTGETSTGVEVHATVFLNLWRRDWLNELPGALECLVFVGAGVLFGFGLAMLRPWWAVWAAIVGFGLVTGGALALFWGERLWFPWLIIGVVQIPCALVWSIIAHTRLLARDKELLKKRLGSGLETAELIMSPERASAVVLSEEPRRTPTIPDHTVLRCVGRGAYGEVWLARDIVGSYHAVKVIYRDRFSSERPFEREFNGIQKYSPISRSHPGWVHILHVGRNERAGCFFYIMELGDDEATGQQIDPDRYVPKSLAGELRKRGRWPLEECLALGAALADALEHLHKHSLIHRDIKPSNVIFVHGQPKFTDIGLVTEIGTASRDVSYLGTEGYIAPEGPGTPAADVYGLGILLYEVSTGCDHRAFPELPTAMLEGAADEAWQEFYRVILKACDPDPRHRYPSAGALHADLVRLQAALR